MSTSSRTLSLKETKRNLGLLGKFKGSLPTSGARPDWARPGLARRFETTRRRRTADL